MELKTTETKEKTAQKEQVQFSALTGILNSMRPKQWTKNLALFAALIFSQTASDPYRLTSTINAFLIFCLLSGAVYIFNDLLDIKQDRQHPKKRLRPIASGCVNPRTAAISAILFVTIAFLAATFLPVKFLYAALAYAVLQIGYTLWLKHTVILDVFTIAIGFLIRVVAGAEAISVNISSWLLICTILLALFLALSKRRHELTALEAGGINHRRILAEYSTTLLDQMISVVTSATVVSYALYTVSDETIAKFGTHRLIYTVPFVLYGIFRYMYLVYKKDKGGSPDAVLLTDGPLLASIVWYVITVALILYVF